MRLTRSKKIRIIITAVIAFIIALAISTYILLHGSTILVKFRIKSLTNDYTTYTLKYDKVKAADHYRITILDNDNVKIFDEETKDTTYKMDLTNLEYGVDYSLMVYAVDSTGDSRPAEEAYTFTWEEPTISTDSSIVLNNMDYLLYINGSVDKKDYKLTITSDNKTLLEADLKDTIYEIKDDLYKDKSMMITATITCEGNYVDSINLYNDMNPISTINITSPKTDSTVSYDDVSLAFEGGENAASYTINIYNDKNKLVKSSSTTKKNVVISQKLFEQSATYKLEVVGTYDTYEMSSSVNITMSSKSTVKPVYISNNWKSVKKGTKLTLKTATADSKIYYTLDGSDPESNGKLYSEPIEINEDTELKTVAVNDKMNNSEVSTYDIKVANKTNLKVYVSPSNQVANLGVSSVGYTNERDEMNEVANYVVERLKEYGVTVYRNNPATGINAWIKDSNYYGVDCHIAIHSNASNNHDTYGVETWIDSTSSQSYSLANLVQENLVNIYPYNDLEDADRGVKYANGALGEVNNNYLNFGLLVEVAHHDYEADAKWIMENKKEIGYNIADSILKYYQIIE